MSVETLLRTDGLHCASCIYTVERLGRKIAGVEEVRADAAAGTILVRHDGRAGAVEAVADILRRLGHSAYPA